MILCFLWSLRSTGAGVELVELIILFVVYVDVMKDVHDAIVFAASNISSHELGFI